MEWSIRQPANEPSTILDPYMGSGTTSIAAVRRRRRLSTDRRGISPDLSEWAGWRAE
jgi:hypothetical protein